MERPQFPYAQRRPYDPWKSEAGRGRWTRPEDEERRRQAYESAINDDAAAEILGINTPTFAAWRRARGIVSKVAPGQKRHMTQGQFDVLDYLKAHPWTKTYTMAKEMGIHRWTLELRLRALERKDAVDVAMKGRVKHFALVGAEIHEGFMRFDRGAPGIFHTGLAQRIVEILRTEPWITKTMIQKRLGALARAKAVEQCLINGYRDGKFTRREVKTSSRRMHAYALPESKRFSPAYSRRIHAETMELTGHGKAADQVLKALRARGWSRSGDLKKSGVPHGFIYNVLAALLEDGKVRRVPIVEEVRSGRRGRGARYAWAPIELHDPCPWPLAPQPVKGANDLGLARFAAIVQENPWATTDRIQFVYGQRFRKITHSRACQVLKRLVDLGIIVRAGRGRTAKRFKANGGVDRLHWSVANAHFLQVLRSSRALRSLGYRVDFQMRPIAQADVGAPPPMPSSKNLERSEEPSELDELGEEA